jgi:hypothetical protein
MLRGSKRVHGVAAARNLTSLSCSVGSARVAVVERHSCVSGQMATNLQNGIVESLGFGDLPPHVLETLMYHVLQLGDVDVVRSCRLVCKAWHRSGSCILL